MPTCRMFCPGSSTAIACTGRIEPKNGHRFNPNKVVLDPYAKLIGRELKWADELFGYKFGDSGGRSHVRRARTARPSRPWRP